MYDFHGCHCRVQGGEPLGSPLQLQGQSSHPVLWMVDDQICVSHCGLDSALATTPQHLDKPQEERLQFGAQKCLKLHVGIKCRICPELSIDTWKLEKPSED